MLLMLIENKDDDVKWVQIAQMARYLFQPHIEIFTSTINMI